MPSTNSNKPDDVQWEPLYRLSPRDWQYFIRGKLRTAWTTFTPEHQALLKANAESLVSEGLTYADAE